MAQFSLFPSITPDNEPFVDNTYTAGELANMEWDELRAIAAEVESDEINGHSDRATIEEFLTGHERL